MAVAPEELLDRLRDERSRRVAFVSHCLLNENTRYPGGAFRPGAVAEVVQWLLASGTGIVQMPCPEQRAWGGVLKRRITPVYGSRGTLRHVLLRPALAVFVLATRLTYRRLARGVARDIADYVRSGFEVTAIVGVGGSPSCGVLTTLDLRRSVDVLASCPLASLDRHTVNERAIAGCRMTGEGLFVAALRRELGRRGLDVPLGEHDLLAEMRRDQAAGQGLEP